MFKPDLGFTFKAENHSDSSVIHSIAVDPLFILPLSRLGLGINYHVILWIKLDSPYELLWKLQCVLQMRGDGSCL